MSTSNANEGRGKASSAARAGTRAGDALPKGQLLIGGRFVDARSGESYDVTNPATGRVLTSVAKADKLDIDDAVIAARKALRGPWGKLSGVEREKILRRLADELEKRSEDLALRQTLEMGKPITQSAEMELPFCAAWMMSYAGWASKIGGETKPVLGERVAFTRREPVGVVAALTPFNFPLALTITKLAPALAAGNVFILKPASITPLSALALAEVVQAAGLPEGVFQLITGPGSSLGDAFSHHPGIDKIAFTGSTDIGRRIVRESSSTLKHVTMELGGKSPNIVFADADLDQAARFAFSGSLRNLGQLCTAGTRLLLERPIHDEIVAKLRAALDASPIGDPLDEKTFFGPAASKEQYDKILSYTEIGKNEGATVAWGGGGALSIGDGKGLYVQPTLFTGATNRMRIAQEEIFGPILTIIPFSGVEEAIAIANDSPYGLNAAVHTRDVAKALTVAARIEAGTVHINSYDNWDVAAPFGGYKQSGYGRESGREVLESYTQTKTIWINTEAAGRAQGA